MGQDILTYTIGLVVVVLILVRVIRSVKGKQGPQSGCGDCPGCDLSNKKRQPTQHEDQSKS